MTRGAPPEAGGKDKEDEDDDKDDDDKDDDWIEYVYARNAAGAIVGIQKFVPTDEKPTITFTAPEGSGAITPFSYCNLHGLWKGDSI